MAKSKQTSSSMTGTKSAPGQRARIKAASAQAFAQLKSEMVKSGINSGITTNQFIFNRIGAYLGLRAKDGLTGMDGQPFLLSPAGKSMDAIARSLARRMGAICQANQLEASSLGPVLNGMFVLSTQEPLPVVSGPRFKPTKSAYELPHGPKSPVHIPSPSLSRASPSVPSSYPVSMAYTSVKPYSSPSPALSTPIRSAVMRSLVPSKSTRAAEQARYDARLESLAADICSLLATGPEKLGPIPAAKREYVEQLLALIEEHHESYGAGRVSSPFRFSHDEKNELENFCPAFKLTGLDWLEMEGRPPQPDS